MSTGTARKIELAPPLLADDYLGPARVLAAAGRELTLALASGAEVKATVALAFPYEPAVDDVLLAIGRGEGYWIIGVIHGSGKTSMAFHGDVDLKAVGGSLSLSADKGVAIAAPAVDIRAGKLQVLADRVVEKFTTAYQRVSELLSVHAKESHTVVDEAAFTKAKTAAIFTEETMTLNGKEIHLG